MPNRNETPRAPEQTNERSVEARTERGVNQIQSRIPYYRQNIVPANQSLELAGYPSSQWDTANVLKFESYIFIASRDKTRIAGFMLGRNAQGDTVTPFDVKAYPEIFTVLKDKFGIGVTPPVERAEQARRTEQERRPEARLDGSVESVLAVLQSISVESGGQRLNVTWPSATALSRYLRTNGVPVARYPQYIANIRDHATLLTNALRSSSFRGRIAFDGQHLIASDGTKTLMTTATRVLVKSSTGRFTTLTGQSVSVTERAASTEYGIGGRTEIHRRDGGLQMTQEGSLIRYFDGSNVRPLIEKDGDDIRVNGPYDSVGLYPGGDAEAYGREIAQKLRTPEAIGAFVSQFYRGQDYRNAGQLAAWRQEIQRPTGNPVQYVGDPVDHAQDWKSTLRRGAGDCEDFALLAKGLLRQIGINSITMMVDPEHYETAFFEHAPGGGYYVCTVGLNGFIRSTQAYPTTGQAVATLWKGSGSGAQFALTKPEVRADVGSSYSASSPGIFALLQPGEQAANVDMIEYSNEAYLRNFVRR